MNASREKTCCFSALTNAVFHKKTSSVGLQG
jgi:hypothetical protein